MIFRKILTLLLVFLSFSASAAECSLYETMHPAYLLNGAHLSTSKCSTCASCHKAGVFTGTPKTCIACHNGDPARATVGRSAVHIPTLLVGCENCHNTTSFTATYTMNHTSVASILCKTCHNGMYASQGTLGALGKPLKHIPEDTQLLNGASLDCNACHKSLVAWNTVNTASMNHNGTVGNGAGWCKGCHLSGTSYLGSMERMSLTHYQRTPVPTDCSMIGCHRPLGNRGSMYVHWDN
jgi:hypothetical protein